MRECEAGPERLVWATFHVWSRALRECHRQEYCREQGRRFGERVVLPVFMLTFILTINLYGVVWWLFVGARSGSRSLFWRIWALFLEPPISNHPFERILILLIILSAAVLVKLVRSEHICRDCVVAEEVSKQVFWRLRSRRYRITCDWTSFVMSEWPALRQKVQIALSGRWDETFVEKQLAGMILKPADLLDLADREGLEINRQKMETLIELGYLPEGGAFESPP